MHAFLKFNKGILKLPLHWQLWLAVLVASNLVVPFVYLQQLEAQVVLGTFLASMILMVLLTASFGFTRILGLGHVLWVPMLAFLLARLGDVPADNSYGIWIRALVVLNSASLAIDTVDVIRYLVGDRKETITGL